MGNTESNVTSGVKKQADTSSIKIYKLVGLKGDGMLVDMMKRAVQNKQYAEVDHAIRTKVDPFIYNNGEGKVVPISHLVLMRNKDRPRHRWLPPLRAVENPDDWDPETYPAPECKGADPNDTTKFRTVYWDLKERGAVGETILHLCLLNATSIHADLAKRILKFYPKLINDIYLSDEYYGENVLHIAVVNEDPAMVKFLLDNGANVHERFFGNFMSPEDQKASRSDSLDHEWVNVAPITNYEGYVYWGEYPLSLAACLGQEESYRLILAKGANPDNQDTNGNTSLHMLVIYSKIQTFDMAYEVGCDLSIRNVQNLTPLTLAAKLAKIEMFFHILNIEREIYWQIGSITCAAYPLSQIDTIDNETGNINKDSALNLVVFGDKDEHLELMDGVLIDLLNAKWNAFVKSRFYRQFFLFAFYFVISLVCFILRPGPKPVPAPGSSNGTQPIVIQSIRKHHHNNSKWLDPGNVHLLATAQPPLFLFPQLNTSAYTPQYSEYTTATYEATEPMTTTPSTTTSTTASTTIRPIRHNMVVLPKKRPKWLAKMDDCRLLQITGAQDVIRMVCEIALEIGSFLYILAALREARFLGLSMFIENMMTAPSRVMFLFSCVLWMTIPLLRFRCDDKTEDIVAVVIMLTTAPYFLFFCRGFKTVGPFVVMIYRMIQGDLIRFASIYLVFVLGFSQAYYIIFLSFDNPLTPDDVDDSMSNPVPNPIEAVMAMFFMSLTNFGDYYTSFEKTDHENAAKLLFVIYMGIVAILLVNMLIAMMGNTYQKIAETRNEWQRQWARIVLVVERGVSPSERLTKLMWYSQPMSDGRRALVLRLNQSEEDKEDMREILEMKRVHNRMVQKRLEGEKVILSAPPTPEKSI